MDNVLIEINKKTRQVFLTNSVIGNDGENLQENLVFSFNDEFVDGTGRLELIKPDKEKSYIMLEKIDETYQVPVKSIITKGGRLTMQLVITQGTDPNAIPIFKSNKFYVVVNSSINFLIEEPDEYPQWIDVANTKLNEIDEAIQEASNLDIDVNKEDNVATITLTDKEGQTKEVQILDGERGPQGIQGETGPAGADGIDGRDATINGVNTLNIEAGENITLEQEGDTLTINSTGGGEVTSVNGQTGDVVIDIPDVSDFITKDVNNLTYYELKTATGNSIAMSIDSSTYVLTVSLKNSAGTILNTQTVDLPLETMVIGGSYDSTNKKIILTLKNGETIEFSVADLVSGLQSEITSSNKLDSDLVDDTNSTNKFVSASDKTTWNAKYDKPSGGIPSTDLSSAVQTSLGKADTAIQDISGKEDTSNKVSSITSSSTNIEYAGAKAVWDLVSSASGGLIGDYFSTFNGVFDFTSKEIGIYMIRGSENQFSYRKDSNSSTITLSDTCGLILLYYKHITEIGTPTSQTDCAMLLSYSPAYFSDGQIIYTYFAVKTDGTLKTGNYAKNGYVLTNSSQQISGEKVFKELPRLNGNKTLTMDTQLTPKKYVDDSISNAVGSINTILATLTTPGGGE